jgi:hypothetical protein
VLEGDSAGVMVAVSPKAVNWIEPATELFPFEQASAACAHTIVTVIAPGEGDADGEALGIGDGVGDGVGTGDGLDDGLGVGDGLGDGGGRIPPTYPAISYESPSLR